MHWLIYIYIYIYILKTCCFRLAAHLWADRGWRRGRWSITQATHATDITVIGSKAFRLRCSHKSFPVHLVGLFLLRTQFRELIMVGFYPFRLGSLWLVDEQWGPAPCIDPRKRRCGILRYRFWSRYRFWITYRFGRRYRFAWRFRLWTNNPTILRFLLRLVLRRFVGFCSSSRPASSSKDSLRARLSCASSDSQRLYSRIWASSSASSSSICSS